MVSKFSNFPDELSENGELREYELSGSDCIRSMLRALILLFVETLPFMCPISLLLSLMYCLVRSHQCGFGTGLIIRMVSAKSGLHFATSVSLLVRNTFVISSKSQFIMMSPSSENATKLSSIMTTK